MLPHEGIAMDLYLWLLLRPGFPPAPSIAGLPAQEGPAEQADDTLEHFEAQGAAALPPADRQGHVEHDGARLWYASYGEGPATVVLLHGGLGHSGNWGYQVGPLVASGHRVVLIDSRGHGRSTRDERPYSYERMASDVLAVMDALRVERAALVGWSDGACTALVLARRAPTRVAGVFFFGCNMDPSGARELEQPQPLVDRCFARHAKDYGQLSPVPDRFDDFVAAVTEMMKTQPNYSARELAEVQVPVAIVQSEHDEFIRPEHAAYLARSIPGAELVLLRGVSHFAPLQRPQQFNRTLRAFLARLLPQRAP
jgi:pimeloyl-ACP methyl ester carboxylesterase